MQPEKVEHCVAVGVNSSCQGGFPRPRVTPDVVSLVTALLIFVLDQTGLQDHCHVLRHKPRSMAINLRSAGDWSFVVLDPVEMIDRQMMIDFVIQTSEYGTTERTSPDVRKDRHVIVAKAHNQIRTQKFTSFIYRAKFKEILTSIPTLGTL